MTDAEPAIADAAPFGNLERTVGYLVADVRGFIVGRVEAAMYGASERLADALLVRRALRRRLIPAGTIAAIDEHTSVVGLRIERRAIKAFL